MSAQRRVLVAGATGYLGGFVAKEFKSRGYYVRALARSPRKLDPMKDEIDEIVKGEVTDPESIKDVCVGIDVVFSSIGITRQRDGLTYMDVDYQGNKNLLEEAKKHNISKYIYVSVLNADKISNLKGVQAKLRFMADLKNSGLNYSIVSPNGFFSDMLDYLRMAKKGRGYVIGSGQYRLNPIHGADLAEVCVNAVDSVETEIDVGGPELFTHNEILTIAFESFGKPVKIYRVPIWLRNLFLSILRACTSVKIYGPIEFFLTVVAKEMVAPTYGKHHLKEFFLGNKDSV